MPVFDLQDLSEILALVGGSDDDQHYHALETLLNHQELTRAPLIEWLRASESEITRSRCATVLAGMSHPEAEQALLRALQEDTSWLVRQGAVTGLRNTMDPAAVPILMKALGDRNEVVRRWCADLLGRLGDERAVPRLSQALRDRDEWTRYSAAEALRRWQTAEARQTLAHLTEHALDPAIRRCASQTLREWDQEQAG